ncbi:hypothetical protein M3Y97_01012200 [Aphelenchoides bicaudatus]|nr:hypothetical protein M3Y97_01012200 [Aphelenchoides bicaudatus]
MGSGINTKYLQTNRGVIRIALIVLGIILSGMLCGPYYVGHAHCFFEGRMSYTTTLNFVTLIVNIVLFVLALINMGMPKLEKIYAIVCAILFIVSFALLVWFVVVYGVHQSATVIVSVILVFIMAVCHLWDFKILNGEASN